MVFIRSLYNTGDPLPGEIFTLPSRAVQDEKQVSDINYIVSRYAEDKSGVYTLDLGQDSGTLVYGDATLPGDYSTALDLVQSVTQEFYELPAKIRAEFDHDPMKLVNALGSPDQRQRLIDLNLLSPEDTTTSDSKSTSEIQNVTKNSENTKNIENTN